MSELPFDDLLPPAILKGARTLRALTALIAASLLAACGTGNGGYQQGYASCAYSALGCNRASSNYGYAAQGPAIPNRPPGFYPIQPDFSAYGITGRQQPVSQWQPEPAYQTPPAAPPQTPSGYGWSHFLGSSPAAAAETSSRREPDPPVAVDSGDKCGWWRLCNLWGGQ